MTTCQVQIPAVTLKWLDSDIQARGGHNTTKVQLLHQTSPVYFIYNALVKWLNKFFIKYRSPFTNVFINDK